MRNLRVARDPADISHASELVLGMDIEDVLEGQGSSEEVTSSGVNDTLWLAGGSRGLKEFKIAIRYKRELRLLT